MARCSYINSSRSGSQWRLKFSEMKLIEPHSMKITSLSGSTDPNASARATS